VSLQLAQTLFADDVAVAVAVAVEVRLEEFEHSTQYHSPLGAAIASLRPTPKTTAHEIVAPPH
jgi:hypothetical protein